MVRRHASVDVNVELGVENSPVLYKLHVIAGPALVPVTCSVDIHRTWQHQSAGTPGHVSRHARHQGGEHPLLSSKSSSGSPALDKNAVLGNIQNCGQFALDIGDSLMSIIDSDLVLLSSWNNQSCMRLKVVMFLTTKI